MTDQLSVYVDRLRFGKSEQLAASVPPKELDLGEGDGHFVGSIEVQGEAYRADDELVLCFNLLAKVVQPCKVCAEDVEVAIEIANHYIVEDLTELRAAVIDCRPRLREILSLEVPRFVECGGQCAQRTELKQYEKKVEGFRPFEDL